MAFNNLNKVLLYLCIITLTSFMGRQSARETQCPPLYSYIPQPQRPLYVQRRKTSTMVNLPKNESLSPIEEVVALYRRHRRIFLSGGPTRLTELEEFADVAYSHVKLKSNRANLRQEAMNNVRQMFKLEFKMLCDVCGTAHNQDEITAPER